MHFVREERNRCRMRFGSRSNERDPMDCPPAHGHLTEALPWTDRSPDPATSSTCSLYKGYPLSGLIPSFQQSGF